MNDRGKLPQAFTLVVAVLLFFSFSFGQPATAGEDGEETSSDYLSRATRKAIQKTESTVVNIRPVYDMDKLVTYEEFTSNVQGRLKNLLQEIESELSDSDKRALRFLFHRLRGQRGLAKAFMERVRQINRERDMIDYLQYMAPPEDGFSGVVLEDGYVLTSAFAVTGRHREGIEVRTPNDTVGAKKLGHSKPLDVALLKLTGEFSDDEVDPVSIDEIGDRVRTGYWAIAVGRSPTIEDVKASRGIISAKNRRQGRVLQSDVLCNYTNAGGPLIDIDGDIIGIVTGITLQNTLRSGQNSGVTSAVKPEALRKVFPKLKKGEEIGRPFLGVSPGGETENGVEIDRVIDNSSAAEADMKSGDVISEFHGHDIKEWRDLVNAIRKMNPGDHVTFKVIRDGEVLELETTLTERGDR